MNMELSFWMMNEKVSYLETLGSPEKNESSAHVQ